MKALLALLALVPSVSLAQDWDMGTVRKEISDLKERVAALEAKWDMGVAVSKTCPCPDGPCICKAGECDCLDCPEHKKTGNGRRNLVFGATWCGPCKVGEANCDKAGLVEGVDYTYHDFDQEKELAAKYNVKQIPCLVKLNADGTVGGVHIGPTFLASEIKNWLSGKPLPAGAGVSLGAKPSAPAATCRSVTRYGGTTWTWPGNLRSHLESEHGIDTSGLSDSELRTVHDNLHNTGRSGIGGTAYYQPAKRNYYAPAYNTGYRAYQPRVYYRQSNCPSCVR